MGPPADKASAVAKAYSVFQTGVKSRYARGEITAEQMKAELAQGDKLRTLPWKDAKGVKEGFDVLESSGVGKLPKDSPYRIGSAKSSLPSSAFSSSTSGNIIGTLVSSGRSASNRMPSMSLSTSSSSYSRLPYSPSPPPSSSSGSLKPPSPVPPYSPPFSSSSSYSSYSGGSYSSSSSSSGSYSYSSSSSSSTTYGRGITLPGLPGGLSSYGQGKGKRWSLPGRRPAAYVPSLWGLLSGRTSSSKPTSSSGFEIRFPIARRQGRRR